MLLFCNINAYAGFEFDREVVGEDGDLLDEPSDQFLVKVCDLGCLLTDEALQLLDPVHGFLAAVAVDGSFFFLFPEPEDFVRDGIVVLLVVSLLDELLLQFFQPCLNAVRRKGVCIDHGLGDVLLQSLQEGLSFAQNLVERLDCDLLQDCLIDRAVVAWHFCGSRFQSTDAPPDDGFAAVVVPVNAAVEYYHAWEHPFSRLRASVV